MKKKDKKKENKLPKKESPPKKMFDGMELAKAMNIHFADLDTIMYVKNLKPGFKTTAEELIKDYKEIIGR